MTDTPKNAKLKVAVAQIRPVFLDAEATWNKLKGYIIKAKKEHNADLVCFGETLIPGYPAWLSLSGGAKFDDPDQKAAFSLYWQSSVTSPNPPNAKNNTPTPSPIILDICKTAAEHQVMICGGIAEALPSGSTFCSLLTVDKNGKICGLHRKLSPTYEEKLIWGAGTNNTHSLQVMDIQGSPFKMGALNCFENWLPLPRAILHDQGETLHVAVWPGSYGLTKDITRFMALEGRSYVISASAVLCSQDLLNSELPSKIKKKIQKKFPKDEILQNGGSMIVDPRGEVLAGPLIDSEGLLVAEIDFDKVIQERQNMEYSGHYSRRDVFEFKLKSNL